MVEPVVLPIGREFLEDHDKVVSATSICLGGASANGVNSSEGEFNKKIGDSCV